MSGSLVSRLTALAVGMTALASLRAQYDALVGIDMGERLWSMAGYFTILTNLGVAVTLLAVAQGVRVSARWAGGLTLSIAMVGLMYHLVLKAMWQPQGLARIADFGLHGVVPVAVALWWLAFADKRVGRWDILWWLVWPVAYCAYALLRGAETGFWPYAFLNADVLGLGELAANIGKLTVGFVLGGAGLVALAKILPERQPVKKTVPVKV